MCFKPVSKRLTIWHQCVTNDKELASLAMLQKPPGVILLRLSDERTYQVTSRKVLNEYSDKIEGHLIVPSERRIRIRPI